MGLHLRLSDYLARAGLVCSAILLAACTGGLTSMGRPVAGQVQMVEHGGERYALRVIPDFATGGRVTRLVAPSAEVAKRVFSDICDGKAYAPINWPEGRLLHDSATGEWAIAGDCPFLLVQS